MLQMMITAALIRAIRLKAGRAIILFTLSAPLFLSGCESELLTHDPYRPTPGQAARDVFDPNEPDKRRKATLILSGASFGGEGPYLETYRTLITDPDPTVRAAALRALGRHGEPADVDLIFPQLKHPEKMVRSEAAVALQRLHRSTAIAPLIQAMNQDENPHIRQVCASALGQYAEPRVLQALIGALDDRDFGVAWQALQSLNGLTGKDLNLSGARWLDWLNSTQTPFAGRGLYTFTAFIRPPNFFDNIQFWKSYPRPAPVPPKGLLAENPDFGNPTP